MLFHVPRLQLMRLTFAVEAGLLSLAFLLGWAFGHGPLERLAPSPLAALTGIVYTVPLLLVLVANSRARWGPMARLSGVVRRLVETLFGASRLTDLALVALLAGSCEEIFFRGLVQSILESRWNAGVAILVTSLLFALAHPLSLLYAGLAGVVSLYLGWLYLHFDSLLVPMVTHALYDFLAILYLRRLATPPPSGLSRAAGSA